MKFSFRNKMYFKEDLEKMLVHKCRLLEKLLLDYFLIFCITKWKSLLDIISLLNHRLHYMWKLQRNQVLARRTSHTCTRMALPPIPLSVDALRCYTWNARQSYPVSKRFKTNNSAYNLIMDYHVLRMVLYHNL